MEFPKEVELGKDPWPSAAFLGLFGQRQILVYVGLSLKSKDVDYSTVSP